MEVLEVKELTKIYGSGENQVTALDHVSFQVKKVNLLPLLERQDRENPLL